VNPPGQIIGAVFDPATARALVTYLPPVEELSPWPDAIPLHPIVPGSYDRKSPLGKQFEAFHRANPHLLEIITHVALDLLLMGRRKCGIKLIWERVRWLYMIKTTRAEGYEGDGVVYHMANAHHPYYARLAMMMEPRLAGFFRLSSQKVPYEPDWEALALDPPAGWEGRV
jgi:hypothetical protein